MKIVNLDGYTTNPGDQSWDWMGNYGDYKVYDRTRADQVVERAKGANLLIINKTVLDRATLEALRPDLEYIGLQSTGYNVVDCAAAKELGITVCNIPAYSTNAVAQLVFAFILSFTNQVAVHTQAVENGEWCRCPDFCFWKTPLMELDGKTLGIFGFGAIAQSGTDCRNIRYASAGVHPARKALGRAAQHPICRCGYGAGKQRHHHLPLSPDTGHPGYDERGGL